MDKKALTTTARGWKCFPFRKKKRERKEKKNVFLCVIKGKLKMLNDDDFTISAATFWWNEGKMMLCFFIFKSKSISFLNGFRLFSISQPLKGVLESGTRVWVRHLHAQQTFFLSFLLYASHLYFVANHKALKKIMDG